MWELQEQDPQLHVYFTESVMGVRLSFFLCIEGIEALNAVLYYKGKGEVFSEEQAYHFPLYLNRHIRERNLFSLSGRGSSIGLIRSKCCCENRKIGNCFSIF